jgi:hypothetical protein
MLVQLDSRATLLRFDRNPLPRSMFNTVERSFIADCRVWSIQIIYRLFLLLESGSRSQRRETSSLEIAFNALSRENRDAS